MHCIFVVAHDTDLNSKGLAFVESLPLLESGLRCSVRNSLTWICWATIRHLTLSRSACKTPSWQFQRWLKNQSIFQIAAFVLNLLLHEIKVRLLALNDAIVSDIRLGSQYRAGHRHVTPGLGQAIEEGGYQAHC